MLGFLAPNKKRPGFLSPGGFCAAPSEDHGRYRIAEPHDRPTPHPLIATRFQSGSFMRFSSSSGMLEDTVLPVSTMSLMNFSTGASSKRRATASTIAALP